MVSKSGYCLLVVTKWWHNFKGKWICKYLMTPKHDLFLRYLSLFSQGLCYASNTQKANQHPQQVFRLWLWSFCLMFSTCLHLLWLSHHILSNTWSPPSGSFWNTPTLIACSPEVSHSSTVGLSRGTGKGLWSHRATNSHSTLKQNKSWSSLPLNSMDTLWPNHLPFVLCLSCLNFQVTPPQDYVLSVSPDASGWSSR